jgi:hypothetical protein
LSISSQLTWVLHNDVCNATFNPCRASDMRMPRYHLLLRVGSSWMYRGDRCFHCQNRFGSHSKWCFLHWCYLKQVAFTGRSFLFWSGSPNTGTNHQG